MSDNFRGAVFDRDALPGAMTQLNRHELASINWVTLPNHEPKPQGGILGSWSSTSDDPLAELLIVRDEDFAETLTWLNAYFSGLSPISQWCRVLPLSQGKRLKSRSVSVGLGNFLGAWVGAILAECSVQAGGVQSLRELSGSAALSTSTFAAGRAAAIWRDDNDFRDIARRHDELSQSLRDGSRPIAAEALVPLWSVLSGKLESKNADIDRATMPLAKVIVSLAESAKHLESPELIADAANFAAKIFDLPELIDCAAGPQVERVKALDRLGDRLSNGPQSPAIDALLGLGASFVDPGASVSPELLRRYARQLPIAPIWQGLFAGIISPIRAMTDQGGLGRIVAKMLLANDDLQSRPSCDIAFEELIRRIAPGRALKLDVLSMSARVLSVELIPGVTCAFAIGRQEPAVVSPSRAELAVGTPADRGRSAGTRSIQELDSLVSNMYQRLLRLEAQMSEGQPDLGLTSTKDERSRKPTRYSPTRAK